MNNKELAAELRKLADLYEANPELPQAYGLGGGGHIHLFCHSAEQFASVVRAVGPGKRHSDDSWLDFDPANYALLRISASKANLCRRVVKGIRHVVETVKPEEVIPAHDEEIVAWEGCPYPED